MSQAQKELVRRAAIAYAETEEPNVRGELERVFEATYGLLVAPGEAVVRWSHGRLQADSPFREMPPAAAIIFIATELVRAVTQEEDGHIAELAAELAEYTGEPHRVDGVANILRGMRNEMAELRADLHRIEQVLADRAPERASGPRTTPARSPVIESVDLEIRVTTPWGHHGQEVLEYDLSSPSGATDHYHEVFRSLPLQSPESFRETLFERLEKLRQGLILDGEKILSEDVEYELDLLGRDLFRQLFPSELRRVFGEVRGKVKTVLITSDESWIPWELLKGDDTDFFAGEFQLTRWVAGALRPKDLFRVGRLACFEAASTAGSQELPDAAKEGALLAKVAAKATGVVDQSPALATFAELKALLESGAVDLLHFAGHGEYDPKDPDDSRFVLADRSFRPRDLLPVESQVREIRPLVFLNACQSARQGRSLTGLGGWASRWVRECGCGAFLGPMWAVRDEVAHRFAEIFYGQLAEGRTIGQAVESARQTIREEHPGSLGWLTYAVYAHPNGHVVLGSQTPPAEDFKTRIPKVGVAPEIRRRIRSYDRYLADKTQGFVGRQWIFDAIERFVRENPRGYFVLYGDPGIGKSALLAQMVRRSGHPHHFNIRREGISRAEDFLSNISAQLIASQGLRHTFLPPEATQDGSFLKELLDEVSAQLVRQREELIILVDALDETDTMGEPAGVNPLYLPLSLPQNVYVVLTSRRGPRLRIECEMQELEIGQDDEGNLADVRVYVEGHLERPGILAYIGEQKIDSQTFAVEMVDKSQGNFMYLHHVLPEIEKGVYRNRTFAALPKGLQNYYEDHWSRMRSRDEDLWFDRQLPVLVALTVVKEPVSVDLITDFSGVEDRKKIRQVLVEWDAFLYSTEVVDEETGEKQKRYRLYHESFHDFIYAKDEVAGERVDLKAAHGKIADVLWKEIYGEE